MEKLNSNGLNQQMKSEKYFFKRLDEFWYVTTWGVKNSINYWFRKVNEHESK